MRSRLRPGNQKKKVRMKMEKKIMKMMSPTRTVECTNSREKQITL